MHSRKFIEILKTPKKILATNAFVWSKYLLALLMSIDKNEFFRLSGRNLAQKEALKSIKQWFRLRGKVSR